MSKLKIEAGKRIRMLLPKFLRKLLLVPRFVKLERYLYSQFRAGYISVHDVDRALTALREVLECTEYRVDIPDTCVEEGRVISYFWSLPGKWAELEVDASGNADLSVIYVSDPKLDESLKYCVGELHKYWDETKGIKYLGKFLDYGPRE